MEESQVKHLQMIQDVITRMARNSFALKGWAVALAAAIFVLANKGANPAFLVIAAVPITIFAGLDAQYLRLERLFRHLYDDVRMMADEDWKKSPFTMDIRPYLEKVASWQSIAWSWSVAGFYGALLAVIAIVELLILVVYFAS